ncbi:MAG TPA: UvrD-helicase domain-containing protein, partial [Casimicrobiaceae bacterium]|nr:UvrD-helicase domain-containing protein [Casimicrobiaceae bacterium]
MPGHDHARDAHHRRLALDPRRSYLVQAPAGSGKTELLIQRYLALLATVATPQRVVAITFTRKAANEMRERVTSALRDARDARPVSETHERVTRDLADAALARADALGWSILEYPAQLCIGTIDALCGRIARQAPLLSRLGVSPRAVDNADALYVEAARAALAHADGQSASWRALLARIDNDAEMLVRYLAILLGKRDQWLPHLGEDDPSDRRRAIEALLAHEIEVELTVARGAFDPALQAALVECSRGAAKFLASQNEPLNPWLARCAAEGTLPSAECADVEAWRALANWLLVKDEARFRARMDRRDGIAPAKFDRGHAQGLKDALFRRLNAEAGLAETLDALRSLPSPTYDDDAWAAIEALLQILPQAAAELDVVFAARGTVDHAHYMLAALRALGEAEAPSELLLRLDLNVDHLLVDEFQDTSAAQYRLVRLLTAGWTAGDGRTLFAVGDPMQSIYRFRNAEVRLFLEAKELGRIGGVAVQFIDLARNFRAQGHLVSWVNRVFPGVLAHRNDPWSGAVAFAHSEATHPAGGEGPPTLDLVASAPEEAQRVVARVRAALQAGAKDVAILVRARNDLGLILPALREAEIPFAAVEIDSLADRSCVRDLVSLTHALVQPADRLAALSVLRAPWCGLALADLLVAAGRIHHGLPGLFGHGEGMSADGQARLARVAAVLAPAYLEHTQGALADRVRGAWLALGGPATIDDEAIDLAAAEDYFALLRTYESGGDMADWQAFVDEHARRFATSTQGVEAPVKVMTLFKAKGLEFDTVVIPGLAQARGGDNEDLLKWRAREGGLLLATPRARDGEKDRVYEYLKWLADAESDHELGRVLYVGATRARRRLHLVAIARADHGEWKRPEEGSALAKLWDALAAERGAPPDAALPADNAPGAAPPLRRLRTDWKLPRLARTTRSPSASIAITKPPPYDWARATAAAVGTVSHRLLAQAGREGLDALDVAALAPRVRTDLLTEGVEAALLEGATADVLSVLRALRGDARGRWLFDPSHAEAASEWALAGIDGGAVVHVTLDRSFVAEGTRWIVDFKTGPHEGADAQAFLAREVERYR